VVRRWAQDLRPTTKQEGPSKRKVEKKNNNKTKRTKKKVDGVRGALEKKKGKGKGGSVSFFIGPSDP
jgi:hypothetical protein